MPKSLAVAQLLLLTVLVALVAYSQFKQPRRATFEYDVVSIPDAAWKTQGSDLGADGWDMVSCRRASDEANKFGYECIVKRRR